MSCASVRTPFWSHKFSRMSTRHFEVTNFRRCPHDILKSQIFADVYTTFLSHKSSRMSTRHFEVTNFRQCPHDILKSQIFADVHTTFWSLKFSRMSTRHFEVSNFRQCPHDILKSQIFADVHTTFWSHKFSRVSTRHFEVTNFRGCSHDILKSQIFADVHTTVVVLLVFVGVGSTCVMTGSYCVISKAFWINLHCVNQIGNLHICKSTDTCAWEPCCCAVCSMQCVPVYCAPAGKFRRKKPMYFILKGQKILISPTLKQNISYTRLSVQKPFLELSVLFKLNKEQNIFWWAPCKTSASPHGSVAHRFGTTEVRVPV